MKLDCDHAQASSGTHTSAQVCANFTLRDNESQTDHYHEDCHQETDSCPEFHFPLGPTDYVVSVDVSMKSEDSFLVDQVQLFDDEGNIIQNWGVQDGEARCISDDCNHECWPNAGADFAVGGVKLMYSLAKDSKRVASGSWSNILYKDGHCCKLPDQCASNECSNDGVCGIAPTATTTTATTTSTTRLVHAYSYLLLF